MARLAFDNMRIFMPCSAPWGIGIYTKKLVVPGVVNEQSAIASV